MFNTLIDINTVISTLFEIMPFEEKKIPLKYTHYIIGLDECTRHKGVKQSYI